MDLTGNIKTSVQMTGTLAYGLGTVINPLTKQINFAFSDGNGEQQANLMWHDDVSVAIGAPQTIDLQDGSLKDLNGNAVVFGSVKVLIVQSASSRTTGSSLKVDGGVADPWYGPFLSGDALNVKPGGAAIFVCDTAEGWEVLAARATLRFTNNNDGAGAVDVNIIVIGDAYIAPTTTTAGATTTTGV